MEITCSSLVIVRPVLAYPPLPKVRAGNACLHTFPPWADASSHVDGQEGFAAAAVSEVSEKMFWVRKLFLKISNHETKRWARCLRDRLLLMITKATEWNPPKAVIRLNREKKKKKRCASDPVLLDTWGPWAAKVWEETEQGKCLTSDIDRS